MKPWLVAAFGALLPIALLAMFAAGPVAVFIMLERASDSATAPGTTIALEPAATVTDAEINRLFNDLRSQYLDDRAESITWWLMAAAISLAFITVFVTALGIIIVIAGFVGYRWFKDILEDARRYTGEAQESANQAKTVVSEAQTAATDAVASATQASEIVEQIKQTRQEGLQELEALRARTAEDFATSGEPQDVERIALGFVETTPVDRATAEAFRLQQQGDTAAAIEKWRALANILEGVDDERAARAWFSVGYLYQHMESNDFASAVLAYDEAIRLDPYVAAIYNNRGNAKRELGNYEDAIVDYTTAIRLNSGDALSYRNRGSVKWELGNYEDAIVDLEKSILLNPEDSIAYGIRGSAKQYLENYQDAIADFDEAIRLNSDYVVAYGNRGVSKSKLGYYEDAISDYDEIIMRNPNDPLAYWNRSKANWEIGRLEDTVGDLDEFIRINPSDVDAYYRRGKCQLAIGNTSEALSDFETASDLAVAGGNTDLQLSIEQEINLLNNEEMDTS